MIKYCIPFVLVLLLLSSCNKDNARVEFEIPLQNIDFEIQPGLNTFQVHYFNFDNIPTNSAELFSANNFSFENASAIVPLEGNLSALFGGADFEFIEQLSLRICDAGDFSENCGTEIFYRQPVPLNVGNILPLVPSDISIKQYLTQDKVNIQLKIERLRESPPQFVDTRLELEFGVRQ